MAGIAIGAVVVLALIGFVIARQRRLMFGASVLLLSLSLASVAIFTDSTARRDPAPYRPPVGVDFPLGVTMGQIDAARWIRDHSDRNDVVMTNRHCIKPIQPIPDLCDNRRFFLGAFTERDVLVEGWAGTGMAEKGDKPRQTNRGRFGDPALLALNDRFYTQPTERAAKELIALGVRWIYVEDTMPHAATLEPYANLVHATDGVEVYELVP